MRIRSSFRLTRQSVTSTQFLLTMNPLTWPNFNLQVQDLFLFCNHRNTLEYGWVYSKHPCTYHGDAHRLFCVSKSRSSPPHCSILFYSNGTRTPSAQLDRLWMTFSWPSSSNTTGISNCAIHNAHSSYQASGLTRISLLSATSGTRVILPAAPHEPSRGTQYMMTWGHTKQ